MHSFKNQFALVTGASSGMGRDYAYLLAEQGCHLVLVARRETLLEQIKRDIQKKNNVQIILVPMDLSKPSASDELYKTIKDKSIQISVLINNAAYGMYGDFLHADEHREIQMLQLNIVTLTRLTKLFGKDMVRRGEGHILLVASVGGFLPVPSYATYSASKAYVLSLGEALAYEFKNHGVVVTVLCPSATETEFFAVANQETNGLQQMSMMDSRAVSQIGINALVRGKASIIPGLLNRIVIGLLRIIPRRWMPAIGYAAVK